MSFINSISKSYKINKYSYIEPKINIVRKNSIYNKFKYTSLSTFDIKDIKIPTIIETAKVITGEYSIVKSQLLDMKNIFGSLSTLADNIRYNENSLDGYTITFKDSYLKTRTSSILIENYFKKHINIMMNVFLNKQNIFDMSTVNYYLSDFLVNDSSFKSEIISSLKKINPNLNNNVVTSIKNTVNFDVITVKSKLNFLKLLKDELINYFIPMFLPLITSKDFMNGHPETQEFSSVIGQFNDSINIDQVQAITTLLINKNRFTSSDVIHVKSFLCNYFLKNKTNNIILTKLTKKFVKSENDDIFSSLNLDINIKITDILQQDDFIYIIKKTINKLLNEYFESSSFNTHILSIMNQLHNIYYLNNVPFNFNSIKIMLVETIKNYITTSNWDNNLITTILILTGYDNYYIEYNFQKNIFSDLEYKEFTDSFIESCIILFFYLSLYTYKA